MRFYLIALSNFWILHFDCRLTACRLDYCFCCSLFNCFASLRLVFEFVSSLTSAPLSSPSIVATFVYNVVFFVPSRRCFFFVLYDDVLHFIEFLFVSILRLNYCYWPPTSWFKLAIRQILEVCPLQCNIFML